MTRPAPRATDVTKAHGVITSLDFSGVADVEDLRRVLEKRRRTKIVILETELLNGVDICGVWGKKGKKDIILHAETASAMHRDQIILHEFSHMLLEHEPAPGDENKKLAQALFPDLDPDHFLLRAGLRTEEERSAEFLADLLAKSIRQGRKAAINTFEGVFG